jgi:uncharacterized membrane protein (DUF2068 family)
LKLASGLGLFAAWFGMFRLFKSDVSAQLEWAARHLKLDPDNHLFHLVAGSISRVNRKTLHTLEAGTFFYAVLHVVEGMGLVFEQYWAGYLMVVATSALVPFEIYEVVHGGSPRVRALKVLVLLVNLGFVVYVVIKLRQEHRALRAARRAEANQAGS